MGTMNTLHLTTDDLRIIGHALDVARDDLVRQDLEDDDLARVSAALSDLSDRIADERSRRVRAQNPPIIGEWNALCPHIA